MNQSTKNEPSTGKDQVIHKSVTIHAPTTRVWAALTEPALMQRWMAESEIEILTDWQVGSPILIRGVLHKVKFENRGQVLRFEPEKRLQYTHLSSLSHLPDQIEHHTLFEFRLTPLLDQTDLSLTVSNCVSDAIYHHLAFYWPVALNMLRKLVEDSALRSPYTIVLPTDPQ